MADVNGSLVIGHQVFSEDAEFDIRAVDGEVKQLGAFDASGGVTYRMRANDGTLGYPVYWESTIVDDLGVDYPGPGPLTDVVLAEKIPG